MKPCARSAGYSGNLLQNIGFGSKKTVASIKGSIEKLGEKYQNATIFLYNKANYQPLAVCKPDANGNYQVLGLNNSASCFIAAFDDRKQFNAVIQDNVVPK